MVHVSSAVHPDSGDENAMKVSKLSLNSISDIKKLLLSLKKKIKNLKDALLLSSLVQLDSMFHSKDTLVCWISSFIGIKGNEKAKSALDIAPYEIKIPYSKPKINKFYLKR